MTAQCVKSKRFFCCCLSHHQFAGQTQQLLHSSLMIHRSPLVLLRYDRSLPGSCPAGVTYLILYYAKEGCAPTSYLILSAVCIEGQREVPNKESSPILWVSVCHVNTLTDRRLDRLRSSTAPPPPPPPPPSRPHSGV